MSERWLLRLAVLATLSVYGQTLFFDFAYDDGPLILLNPWMQGWHLKAIFTSTFWGFSPTATAGGAVFYRPLTMLWLVLVNKLSFGMPGFFHLAVVLLHIIVMLEVYALARRLTRDATLAALAALIFGIHPTHIESVAWISGVSDVLCAAFFLAALLAYLRWTDGKGRRWLFVSLLALEAALLSKEAAALLVAIILLDRFRESRGLGWFSRAVHAVYLTAPFLLLTVAHFVWQSRITHRTMQSSDGTLYAADPTLYSYTLWWYLKKQIVAAPVSTHYDTLFAHTLSAWQIALTSLLLVAVVAAGCVLAWRSRAAQLLAVLFALTLAPVVVGVETLQLHDRYLYLPGIAVAIGAAALLRRAPRLGGSLSAQAALVLLFVAVAVPVAAHETSFWSSDIKVFSHSVDVAPNAVLNLETLFDAYIQVGDDVHAEQVLRRTVAQFPERSRQWTRLAQLCVQHDRLDEAEAYARHAIAMRPLGKSIPVAITVLCQVESKRGHLDSAELWCRRAVLADWPRPATHRELVSVLANEGKLDEARAEAAVTRRLEAAMVSPK